MDGDTFSRLWALPIRAERASLGPKAEVQKGSHRRLRL